MTEHTIATKQFPQGTIGPRESNGWEDFKNGTWAGGWVYGGTCYVAFMFDYNDKAPYLEEGYAHRNRNPIPGEKGYNTMNWIDMYFLDIDSKELIHISFGKF